MDGKNGSEPSDAHSPNTPATTDFPVEGQALQVYLSALWPLGSPKGIYQGFEAGVRLFETSRLSIDYLSRRSTDSTLGQGPTPPATP